MSRRRKRFFADDEKCSRSLLLDQLSLKLSDVPQNAAEPLKPRKGKRWIVVLLNLHDDGVNGRMMVAILAEAKIAPTGNRNRA